MRARVRMYGFTALLGTMLAAMALALIPSVASADGLPTGSIEICKTFNAALAGAPQYTGTFSYEIVDNWGHKYYESLTVNEGGPQVCTNPITVAAGPATVYEFTAPWFSISSIAAAPGTPSLTYTNTSTGEADVNVPASTQSVQLNPAIVEYTNSAVNGVIEVCKQADADSSALTGSYPFTITTADSGVTTNGSTPWSTTTSATIVPGQQSCSSPIIVPAGPVETQETGVVYISNITATYYDGTNALLGPNTYPSEPSANYGTGVAYSYVNPGTGSNQTDVTYTDKISTVKLCKAWDGYSAPPASFPFTLTSSGAAGPTTVSGSVSIAPGTCQIVGYVRAGTQVNVTEGTTVGTKVEKITAVPSSTVVPNSVSVPYGKISVIAGPGETDITYTDTPAAPSELKICVLPTGSPTATTVPFAVSGGGVAAHTVNVALSSTAEQCTIDTVSGTDNPYLYQYLGSVSVAGGTLASPDAFTGTPTVNPAYVEVFDSAGNPFVTTTPSLASSTSSSATITMSEGLIEEVTFSIDPPAVDVTAPPVTVTSTGTVVSSTSTTVPSVGGVTLAATPTVTPESTPSTTGSTESTTTNALAAKVAKLQKQLANDKAQIKKLTKKLSSTHLSKALRKADKKKLASLRAAERKILKQLG